jgi:hypothetical protein
MILARLSWAVIVASIAYFGCHAIYALIFSSALREVLK